MTNDDMSSSCSMKSGLVEVLGLSIIPSKYVSGRKRRTYTNCTLTNVEAGSMITQMWSKEIAQSVPILVASHTYTSKSLWWSSVRMVAQNLMQSLVSFNNVVNDSQVCNATSRPIVKYGAQKHTRKEISGVMQPRMSQNVESTKMLLLHNTRETLARLHNRRIRTCAQPTKQKCNDFYPKYDVPEI